MRAKLQPGVSRMQSVKAKSYFVVDLSPFLTLFSFSLVGTEVTTEAKARWYKVNVYTNWTERKQILFYRFRSRTDVSAAK